MHGRWSECLARKVGLYRVKRSQYQQYNVMLRDASSTLDIQTLIRRMGTLKLLGEDGKSIQFTCVLDFLMMLAERAEARAERSGEL